MMAQLDQRDTTMKYVDKVGFRIITLLLVGFMVGCSHSPRIAHNYEQSLESFCHEGKYYYRYSKYVSILVGDSVHVPEGVKAESYACGESS